ncbi:MAG: tRNA sulfurtransferase, partial [Nitrospinota bacterium]
GGALLYTEKLPGPGGLPVGVSGRVVCLMSGGIDSPVAAYRMMKRGCQAVLVHFHSVPYLSRASVEKASELAALLNRYQGRTALYLVPLGELQREVVLATPPPPRVVLYRRFMARIGEAIAARERAGAIVTGESLGQVASQTLSNLATIEGAVELPILRPLIGMDKLEIIRQAEAVGTYEVSIEPDQDCCTLFTPKHPAVRTTPEELRALEERLDVEGMVERALAGAELILYRGEEREALKAVEERRRVGEKKEAGDRENPLL